MHLGNGVKQFLGFHDQDLNLEIIETINFVSDWKESVIDLRLTGKILSSSSKRLSNVEILLSNAHKILAFKKFTAKETNFLTGRSIIFDANPNINEVIEYEIDPSFIIVPLKISATYQTDGSRFRIHLEIENNLEYSKIMGNLLKNVKLELPFSVNPEKLEIEQNDEKNKIKCDSASMLLSWYVDNLNWKEKKNVTFSVNDCQKLKEEVFNKPIRASFLVPDRTISQIFVDKAHFTGYIGKKDLKLNLKYETIGQNCYVKFMPSSWEASQSVEMVEISKEIEGSGIIYCGEEAKIVIKLKNCTKNKLWDVSLYDNIPAGFLLTKGVNYWMGYLDQNEMREIVYWVKSRIAGEYLLPGAKVVFKDVNGKRYEKISPPYKIIVKTKKESENFQICKFCGASLPKDAYFCGVCGRKIR